MKYLSASKYAEYLNVDKSTFIAHVESEGWVSYGGKEILEDGEMKGIIYKTFTDDYGEEIKYIAYPLGLVTDNDVSYL